MIQLDSTEARKFAVHLEGYEGLGEGELVRNGDFSEIGSDLVQNGDFAQIGSELITNGDFSAVPLGSELVDNNDFSNGTTDWTDEGNSTITVGTHEGRSNVADINITGTSTGDVISHSFSWTEGSSYKVTCDVYVVSGSFRIDSAGSVSSNDFVSTNTLGEWQTLIGYVTSNITGSQDFWLRSMLDGATGEVSQFYVDSVSIKEEINLITNPNFSATGSEMNVLTSSGSAWSDHYRLEPYTNTVSYLGSNVTELTYVDNSELGYQYFTSAYNLNTATLTIGKSYKIEVTCKVNLGTFSIRTGSDIGAYYTTGFDNTDYETITIYAYCSGNTHNWIKFDDFGTGQILLVNNISVKELGEDWSSLDGDIDTYNENGVTITSINTDQYNRLLQSSVSEDGKSYKVTYTIHATSFSTGTVVQYYDGINYRVLPEQSVGTHTFYFIRVGTNDGWYFNLNASASGSLTDTVTISSIVVQELGEGWTGNTNGGFSINASGLSLDSSEIDTSGGGTVYSALTQYGTIIEIGKSYKLVIDNLDITSGNIELKFGLNHTTTPVRPVLTSADNGTYTNYFQAQTDNDGFTINSAAGTFATLSSISVKEVGQDWRVQEGWTVEDNKAVCDGLFNNYIGQFFSLPTGSIKVTFEVDSYTSGTLNLWANIPVFTTIISVNTVGTYEVYFKTTSGANNLYFYSVAFIGSITNVQLYQLDPNGYWNTNPNWLIEQGQAVSDGTNVGSLNQAGITTLGKTYVAKYDILTYTSGTGFQQRVGNGSAYSDAETSIATHSITQIATGNDYIYVYPNNTIGSITNVSVRLKNTGAVTLTLTNQLTEKVTTVNLTPLLSNGRYTEFSYQPTGLIEGMYLIKFTGDSTTYAETLAYITTGTPPLGESEYKEYTTGDDNPDYVYIP